MKATAVKLVSLVMSLMVILSMLTGVTWAEDDLESPVIQVDGTPFYDMTSAMNAAGPGSRVTLLGDLSLENQVDISLPGGSPVILDLNGNTINLYDPSNAPGDDKSGAGDTGTGGVLTLRSGQLDITDDSGSGIGTIHSQNYSYPAIRLIQDYETGTSLSIEAGIFLSDNSALITLLDTNGDPVSEPDGQTLSVAVSGGNFDEQLPDSFIADGYELYQEEDNEWGVREKQEPVMHTVIWVNYDETVLYETDVPDGSEAVYGGDTPTRPDDEDYTYSFSGWDQDTFEVYEDMTVTAQFTSEPVVHTYTVTWLNYDGEVLQTAENVEEGGSVSYTGDTPTRPDDEANSYVFSGWDQATDHVTADMQVNALFTPVPIQQTVTVTWQNYDGTLLDTATVDQGSSAVYEGETPVRPDDEIYTYTFSGWDTDTSSVQEDILVTALYDQQKIVFAVTFDVAAEGVIVPDGQTVKKGGFATAPEIPVRDGYNFLGWFLDGEEEPFDFESRPVNDDITLRAHWIQTVYYVSFDLNHEGAEGQPVTQQIAEGQTATKPEDPTAPNAVFTYWTAEADPGVQPQEYDFETPVNSDLILYGYWTVLPVFTVTFDADGGSGDMDPVYLTGVTEYTLPDCAFTAPEGKEFDQWDLGAAGTTVEISADTTVTAQWKDIPVETCTIMFDANGGSGTMDPVTVDKGSAYTLPDCAFTAPEGKEFDQWDLGAAGTTVEISADTTVTAQWKDIPVVTHTVSFNANGGTGTMTDVTVKEGTAYTLPECTFTAPDWMRFKAWNLEDQEYAPGSQIAVSSDIVVSAVWEEIPVHTITFHPNGGSGDMGAVTMHEGTAFVLPACAFTPPAGKVFAGWDRGPAGSEIIIEGDLALNAQWTNAPVVRCTISFDANGGSGTMSPVTVNQGTPFTIPANGFTAPAGKTFAGWDKGIPGSIITVANDTVLKAMWSEEPTTTAVYSVTFYTAHGDIPVGQLVEEGQKVIKPADPKAEGYIFRGWYTEIEYTNIYDFNAPVSKNLTLYAKWEEEPTTKQFFSIAFFTERGTAPAQQSVEKGQLAVKPADPSADGYVFEGWFREKECKNLYDFNTPVTANLTLFAGWSEAPKQSFVVYFQSNGHGNTPNPQPVQSGQKVTKPEDPAATGYTFTGWFTDPAATTAYNFDAPVTSDVMLYAGWTPNRYTVLFDSNEGTGTMESLSCTYDIRSALPADTFTRSGYNFIGWNTKADGSGTTFTDKAVILNLTDSNGETVPLYAQWKNIYSVIEGVNAVVPKDGTSGVTFRVDGDYSKFTGITIDGQNVPMSQYTSWEGSTYVRLNQDYVNKMTEGDHTVKFMYTDGSVETNFDIVSSTPAPTPKPHTTNFLLWIIIIVVIAAVVICTIVVIRLRRKNTR